MSLQIFESLEQGSDEWLAARCGLLTASQVGKLITPTTIKPAANPDSRNLTMQLVAERVTGRTEFVYVTADMERGHLDEPIARDAYAARFETEVTQVGFMTNEIGGHEVGFSPDGLVSGHGLIEVKSRKAKKQISTFLDDAVPLENIAQIQCGLMVSGREWCDYISWSGGLPMFVKRVHPDPRWVDAITEAVIQFEQSAGEMVTRFEAATVGLPATEYIDYYADEVMTF